ncbi:hypothetical protein BN2475_460001 [Paraburkholderia ribeironis]|uniref:Uncharacterized protein n=1 Tax=Paraburkholderia ribeironis TaxID=1247936 RepID=A0A1N7S9D0_9BURK|nr:hypothetical protein BN2475_460001 [Paraburkholderia ribeironis]
MPDTQQRNSKFYSFVTVGALTRALPDMFYTVRFPSGELKHCVTDDAGRTARCGTDGEQRLAIYLGHREA